MFTINVLSLLIGIVWILLAVSFFMVIHAFYKIKVNKDKSGVYGKAFLNILSFCICLIILLQYYNVIGFIF